MDADTLELLSSLTLVDVAPMLVLMAAWTAFFIWQRWSYGAPDAEPQGPHCVACHSQDLEWPAPGCYRCLACGHEGGEGRADLARLERQGAITSWPRPRQLRFAQQRWAEAEHALDEALTVLGGVGVGSALVDAVHASTEGDWTDEAYFRAGSLAQQAAEALADVSVVHPGAPAFSVPFVDAEPGDFGLETHITADGHIVSDRKDLAGLADLRAARTELEAQRARWQAWWARIEAA